MSTDLRPVLSSQDREYPPGRLAAAKRGETSDLGYPQPQAAEVESARLLADDFIAEDRGEGTECFIDWAIRVRRATARRPG